MKPERSTASIETAVKAAAVLVELAASPTTTTIREFKTLLEKSARMIEGIPDEDVKASRSGPRLTKALTAAADALDALAFPDKGRTR